eukprot:662738-Pleurochrysis_carterae.AAC.1
MKYSKRLRLPSLWTLTAALILRRRGLERDYHHIQGDAGRGQPAAVHLCSLPVGRVAPGLVL